MAADHIHVIKIIAGTLVIVAIVINLFERIFRPHHLLLESSPNFPGWLGWLGWILASISAIAYFIADYVE